MGGRLFAAAAVVATAAIIGFSAIPAEAATYDGAAESGFVSRMNRERNSRGLASFAVAADLAAVARKHSADMAAQQRLYHDPNLAGEVGGWQSLGENVGDGGSVDAVESAFMASSTHRAHILSLQFTQVGVGVVWTGSTMWVTVVFRQPTGAAAAAPAPRPATPRPATAPRRVTASAPAPAPTPAPVPVTAPPTTVAMSSVISGPQPNAAAPPPIVLGVDLTRALRRTTDHDLPAITVAIAIALIVGAASAQVSVARRR